MEKSLRLFLIINILCLSLLKAQSNEKYNSSEIQQAIKKLNILGSVLYIAAHPDDENTRLITYFTKDKLYNTGYLSLTRGDGGQNLIGPELYNELGVIRTQELLQARRIDGGKQFFSRARDFGFSKNPDETFTIWDREKVLSDMVWVIRKFRPDVMITRFNTVPGKTHGHHTASAILASEAFEAAADPNRFPEQLKHVEVWQAKRLLWNTNWWFYGSEKDFKTEGLLQIDVGEYNEVLGESYTEIAAKSRSMHKSQGFGSSGTRGSSIEYLEHTKGPKASNNIFEDIDVNWGRIKDGEKVGKILDRAIKEYKEEDPSSSVDILLEARDAILALPESYWRETKLKEIEDVIKLCMGLWTEAIAEDYGAVPGQAIKINVEVINRSGISAELKKITYNPSIKDTAINLSLQNNIDNIHSTQIIIPTTLPYSQPYWLVKEGTLGMFDVEDQQMIGLPENPPAIDVVFSVMVKGKVLDFHTPLVFKKTDPVKGEQYRPFVITPPLFINPGEGLFMFADAKPKEVSVTVIAGKDNITGILSPSLPKGWRAEPSSISFSLNKKGSEERYSFKIFPSSEAMEDRIRIFAIIEKDTLKNGIININYDHIPAQNLFPESSSRIVRLDLKKKGEKIGYIMGAGDEVPTALMQVGYKLTELKEEAISVEKLKAFDAIIIGIRAFNTNNRLAYIHPMLLAYVKNGGTLIAQYNTLPNRISSGKLVTDSIGPYPFKLSNERVTVETAPIRFLKPNHPLLNTPNKISEKDFDGWVQERGLYFPNEWSKEFETVISCNDPGETPKDGGILYSKFGKGIFIYTTYSWFRELPAGVSGAYRLFVNMISAGK